ncbi:MAG: acyl-CoA dehydrogenase family protein [Actinomycetota bacterium]|jgi:3-oxochol-4-en-24-oyl-CoA dehydrogenase|nr:acyl-CoA dehydrogenase family protein [Actinomycetota bacterium]
MDLDLPPQVDAARQRIRSFLAETLGPDGKPPPDWFARLAAAGYTAPHWPPPWGLEASPAEQLVIDEELQRAGVHRPDNPIGIGWAGPTLLLAGTEDQHRRFLPGLLDGSELWCQLFSEPGAGSDLASLSTRAVRDGDEWVVDGQKVWTSLARQARWGILLARTDPDAERHRGISYFVVDMRSPGIEIRPIRQMTGAAEFNEVFLDGVRIPAGNLVGEEGDGWRLARVTLGNERVALSAEGALWGRGPSASDLIASARAGTAAGLHLDALARQRLAALYVEAEVLRFLRLRTLSAQMGQREPGPEASVRKALADHHGQRLFRLALELCGAHGMLSQHNPDILPGPFPWAVGFLFSPALTIGGGTAEVQRNIIAERVLGLPRDTA